jgi:hypothetical protein
VKIRKKIKSHIREKEEEEAIGHVVGKYDVDSSKFAMYFEIISGATTTSS